MARGSSNTFGHFGCDLSCSQIGIVFLDDEVRSEEPRWILPIADEDPWANSDGKDRGQVPWNLELHSRNSSRYTSYQRPREAIGEFHGEFLVADMCPEADVPGQARRQSCRAGNGKALIGVPPARHGALAQQLQP